MFVFKILNDFFNNPAIMNAEFINNQTYAIIISTNNNKVDFAHQTYALAYTMSDIIKARYSEFWSKTGGYKENLILFPKQSITVKSVDSEGNTEINTLFRTVEEYKKYLLEYKADIKNPVEKDEFYDYNHMYKRFYCFGTCVEDKLNNHKWECTWNGYKVNGLSIRNKEILKLFGTVYTFEEFSNLINSALVTASEITDAVIQFKSENKKIKNELTSIKESLIKTERLLNAKSDELLEKSKLLDDVKSNYEARLREETKSRKIELKNANQINKCLKEANSRIKSEYAEHISKLGDENLTLKAELREFKSATDEHIENIKHKYSQQVNSVRTMSYVIMILSFIIGVASMLLIDLINK